MGTTCEGIPHAKVHGRTHGLGWVTQGSLTHGLGGLGDTCISSMGLARIKKSFLMLNATEKEGYQGERDIKRLYFTYQN